MDQPTENPPGPAHQPAAPLPDSSFEGGDDYSKFEVSSRTEILSILRSMRDQGSLITFYFNKGYDFLLTSLVDVSADGRTMVFDYGSNMEANLKVLKAAKINCVSSKEKVKIQFTLQGVVAIQHQGRDAFLGDVPDSLIRLQRREYYRLSTPRANPLMANIPLEQADGSRKILQAVVVDISGGGVGLNVPTGDLSLTRDAEFSGVSFNLPNIGTIRVDMRVRNIHEITMPNGKLLQRAVCQFINLSRPTMDQVQRYITQIERVRMAREV